MLGITSVVVLPQSPMSVFANAAVINSTSEQSWQGAIADGGGGRSGLENDTLPGATASGSSLGAPLIPRVANRGAPYSRTSGVL